MSKEKGLINPIDIIPSFKYNIDVRKTIDSVKNERSNKVVMMNASVNALIDAQKAFQDIAKELGVNDEQNVIDMIKEIRAERHGSYRCE